MKQLTDSTDSINSTDIGKILSSYVEIGMVMLELDGVGTQEICIVSTESNLQGFIRWVICPRCGRRIKKLYLPLGDNIFLCRSCYDLGYRTQYVRTFRKTQYQKKRHTTNPNKRQMSREEMLSELKKLLTK